MTGLPKGSVMARVAVTSLLAVKATLNVSSTPSPLGVKGLAATVGMKRNAGALRTVTRPAT